MLAQFPLDVILQFLADFLLPFVRIAAMVGVMAGIGVKTLPTRIKLFLSVTLTVMVMPVIPPSPFTNLFSAEMISIVIQQFIIGVLIGLSLIHI